MRAGRCCTAGQTRRSRSSAASPRSPQSASSAARPPVASPQSHRSPAPMNLQIKQEPGICARRLRVTAPRTSAAVIEKRLKPQAHRWSSAATARSSRELIDEVIAGDRAGRAHPGRSGVRSRTGDYTVLHISRKHAPARRDRNPPARLPDSGVSPRPRRIVRVVQTLVHLPFTVRVERGHPRCVACHRCMAIRPAPKQVTFPKGPILKLKRFGVIGTVAVASTLFLASCAANEGRHEAGAPDAPSATSSGTLDGAGASSQGSAQEAWVAAFQTANPDVTINYDPCGSGAGREAFIAGGVELRRLRLGPQPAGDRRRRSAAALPTPATSRCRPTSPRSR